MCNNCSRLMPLVWACIASVEGQAVAKPQENFYKSSAVAEMGDRLARTDMGRKVGRQLCPFPWRAGSPSNTMWPGSRPTSLPSGTLIHQTVWSQCTNVMDRTDRTDRQRSDRIGRSVNKRSPKSSCENRTM